MTVTLIMSVSDLMARILFMYAVSAARGGPLREKWMSRGAAGRVRRCIMKPIVDETAQRQYHFPAIPPHGIG